MLNDEDRRFVRDRLAEQQRMEDGQLRATNNALKLLFAALDRARPRTRAESEQQTETILNGLARDMGRPDLIR